MNQKIIINAENAVVGRLASFVAKNALLGKKMEIVNCEKAIITGSKEGILREFLERRGRVGTGQQGPKYPTLPDKIMKRSIRGMLDHKKGRGREALKNIRCYTGIPVELEKEKMVKAGRNGSGIELGRISSLLRGGN
ncbi:50S ribosomal protein L13 [Candidatus Woesearchaeota archaeon CG10_big_fil_rev_8_21_14_0_10_34_12]|nr:MAG: 50S ribosomal protein L13 [Candidatus Woesearchaeota archaeon CG10_big_fil_rev_8_21_14_0_10_34_12]